MKGRDMSDDPVIEKVARAIYDDQNAKRGGRWDLVETKDVWRNYARAALAASGFFEMREALELSANLLDAAARESMSGNLMMVRHLKEGSFQARAALSRARGET